MSADWKNVHRIWCRPEKNDLARSHIGGRIATRPARLLAYTKWQKCCGNCTLAETNFFRRCQPTPRFTWIFFFFFECDKNAATRRKMHAAMKKKMHQHKCQRPIHDCSRTVILIHSPDENARIFAIHITRSINYVGEGARLAKKLREKSGHQIVAGKKVSLIKHFSF